MTRRRLATALVAAAAVGLSGCAPAGSPPVADRSLEVRATPGWSVAHPSPSPQRLPTKKRPQGRVVAQAASRISLVPFGGCDDLLTRMKREALSQVGPYGLPYAVSLHGDVRRAAAPAAMGASSGTAPAYSATNNQEAGVDEADLVKTDGRLMVVLRRQPLGVQVVDVSGAAPVLRGFLRLPEGMYDAQLLLVDGRAVVLGSGASQDSDRYRPRTDVLVVSLDDPTRPRVERTLQVEGAMSAAREVAGRVLLVSQSTPDIAWTHPADGSRAAERRATQENARRIRASGLAAWLPAVRVPGTGSTYRASCGSAMRTQSAAGTATTSLVSLDPSSDVPGGHVTVAGSGSVVYASPTSVYVTTWPWDAQARTSGSIRDEQDVTTSVHRFDVTDLADPRYAGSGSVRGTLVGQYALSEHEGHLRVASTVGRTWTMEGEQEPPSDNRVTVLRADPEALTQVGLVAGLGRGERIYGVRFLGALGYVVTFRQTDPLYVLDLADPAHPARRGELHVTGYSSYLHPLGPGLLLGIGQEVRDNRPQGTQVSTFDVSDERAPRLRARELFADAWSSAEHDPHAVLWWSPARLVVVPLTHAGTTDQTGTTDQGPQFEGVVALRVGADGALRELGRVQHPRESPDGGDPSVSRAVSPWCCGGGILRSVVIGDALLTLSESGVLASDLSTLEERSWAPYR